MSFTHCKHWNGRDMFVGKERKCKAGVNPILSFADGQMTGWVRKVPCVRTNETTAVCPAAEFPSKEEAERDEAEFRAYVDKFIKNLSVVRPLIEQQHKDTGRWSGQVDCPQCGRPLHWSKAQCNGHIHARCETDNCVSWME